jgi:hypothetical protein
MSVEMGPQFEAWSSRFRSDRRIDWKNSYCISTRNHWWSCIVVVLCLTGCQQWPGNTAMRQYQLESDRLLSEFRAQKKRAEELEQRNVQLEQRLDETEKMLARVQGRGSSRLANAGAYGGPGSGNERDLTDIGSPNGMAQPGRRIPGPGLPEASPGTASRLTSGLSDPKSDLRGDPSRPNQWRPIPGR